MLLVISQSVDSKLCGPWAERSNEESEEGLKGEKQRQPTYQEFL
jgi:hypothetical protein